VATEETAMNGSWCVGPGIGLFQALNAQLGAVPILAEDLGVITTDVVKLRYVGCVLNQSTVYITALWSELGNCNSLRDARYHFDSSRCIGMQEVSNCACTAASLEMYCVHCSQYNYSTVSRC
jgi:hypothetical protein